MFEVPPQQLASVRGLGTGNALLWYGIVTRCAKQPPTVREAFSEAFGVKNRLLRYGRDIRCQKQPLWYATHLQRPAEQHLLHRMRFQRPVEQPTPQTVDSTCRTGRIFSARNGLREEASKHKKRVLIKVYQDFLGTLLSLIVLYSD